MRDIRPNRIRPDNSQQCVSLSLSRALTLSSLLRASASITTVGGSKFTIQFYYAIFIYRLESQPRELFYANAREKDNSRNALHTDTRGKEVNVEKKRWKRESRVRENCNVWPTKDIQIGSWTWSDILQWWKMYMNVWMIFSLSLCFTAALALAHKRSRDDDCCLSLLIFSSRITHSVVIIGNHYISDI